MRKMPFFILLTIFIVTTGWGCKEERKVDTLRDLDPSKMPTMSTVNISTLISDSGITQYKIVAPLWNIYDESEEPYWSFPEGIYLQKFDARYNVIATVAADSAKFFKNERLWRLDGQVEMTKKPKDLFLSPRVYWDQRNQKIYSDTFIHIENATHILEGTGFSSNENLTEYRILQPTGIFPINNMTSSSSAAPPPNQSVTPSPAAAPTHTVSEPDHHEDSQSDNN